MRNAPQDPSLARTVPAEQPPDIESIRRELFDAVSYLPLAFNCLEAPPPGQVRLVRPRPRPKDPEAATALEQELSRRRSLLQELLAVGEWQTLLEQEAQFALLSCRMLAQRFQIDDFISRPTYGKWSHRFRQRAVVERAQKLRERHGEVLVAVDLAAVRIEVCGPQTRGGRLEGALVASLEPVIDALVLRGLWLASDRKLRNLAGTLVRLANQEYERLGAEDFESRYLRGGRQ